MISGKGDSTVVPEEIKGWNWGAFFLNAIWGIGNRTFFALFALVPVVNIIVMIVLGFKGNKWAWQNRSWDSVEHFKEVQQKWTIAGYIAFAIYMVVFLKGIFSLM